MNLIDAISAREWAIQPEMLRTILEVANRERSDNIYELMQKQRETRLAMTEISSVREDVAIVPVHGSIFKFANLFTQISGGVSLSVLMRDFTAALENPAINHIILDIDSPGGEANGVNEFAKTVFQARDQKNIVAYVGGMGASGAYWIASAASQIILDDAAFVGSIGVVTTYLDRSAKDAKAGVKEIEIISSSSPLKRPDPFTDEGRAVIQNRVDALQEVFVAAVAQNRGVSEETVLNDFGKGDVLIAKKAIAAGMADRIDSLEGLINSLTQKEIFAMAENQNQTAVVEPQIITAEMIAEQYPQIAEKFREEGKTAERVRIMEIHSLSRPGLEDIISTAMFHSDDDAGRVALQIIEKDKLNRKAKAEALKKDAEDIPALAAVTPENDDAQQQAQIDAAVKTGFESRAKHAPAQLSIG